MMSLEQLKALGVGEFVATWARYDAAALREKLGSSRAALVAFAEGVAHQVDAALAQLHQAMPDDEDELDDDTAAGLSVALQALKLAAQLCLDALHECHASPPEALINTATQLHDHALLELGDARPDVQDVVAKLCCQWWQYGADSREFLVSQALPYLLLRAISTGKAMHVKACFVMRGSLELLDFEDESIRDMKRMLLQAAISPAFVSRPEGRKFLSCLLTVHPSMVAEVASVIRNQIPAGRRCVLDAYGEIILRGWRDAVGPCLAEIEAAIIQNLIIAALHGASQGLVSNIRRVLGELHRAKRLGGPGSVDGMLVRLYEPVLFRALAAANAAVRRNALQVLLDAFPLLDPEASTEEQDELLVRQFQALSDALSDAVPHVRVVAASGICGLLNLYWEIIPSATTAAFVSRLTGQLAFDAALPAVRVAVLEGLQLLVDNQHAQPVLKRALPQLAPLIWDSSPRVREAMSDLLLCISTSRGLHFYEVVPLDVLLGELADGGAAGSTAQKLHQLLVPSYFPGPDEGVARLAGLLKTHPSAGQSFCRLLVAPFLHYLDGGKGSHQVQVPLEDIMQLAEALMQHLLSHPPVADPSSPPRKQQRARAARAHAGVEPASTGGAARGKRKKASAAPAAASGSPQASHEAGSDAEAQQAEEVDVFDIAAREESPDSWTALLAGLAEICCGIGNALQHGLCEEGEVQGLFDDKALQALLGSCPNATAMQCVWRIAEHLPCLAAAKQLLASRLQLLAAGELLPGMLQAGGTAGGGEGAATDAAALLACLAAARTGPKLAALLCAALGLDWPGAASVCEPVAAAGAAGAAAASVDDICCCACGNAQPEHNLLLCDGCDDAFHTTCLAPALEEVPAGDWFCPRCCSEVRSCQLDRNAALGCVSLLLQSDSGRQLLEGSGLLAKLLPTLQHDAAAAAAAAAAAQAGSQSELVAAAAAALQATLLHARASMHALAASSEEQPAVLAQGVTSIFQAAAAGCRSLGQLPQGLQPGACAELLGAMQQLAGLLQDLWAALKALGTSVVHCEQVVAAAAAAAAECGHALLAGLAAAGGAGEQAGSATSKGVLALNTHLLRMLLASCAAHEQPLPHQARAWLLLWLRTLCTGQLAGAAAAVRQDVPAIVAALLPGQPAATASTRAGTSASAATASQPAAVTVSEWLPLLAEAAAQAEEVDDVGGDDDDDDDGDAENRNPNAAAPAGGSCGAKVAQGGGVPLPAVASALLAAAQQCKVPLVAPCLQLAVSAARAGDWAAGTGALRLAGRLRARGDAAWPEAQGELAALRVAAAADNGTDAHLFGEALGQLLAVG